ncbi:putative disease resistance RPP13-like protein 3 [Cornus florida]|uniref:putative disease resistance RPP13-like protein 3 n=1 Tax=Cornus florida TaxID=4283 RepID=UPI00289C350D|nr:putative disease resistance RPP13-like protein 3 [Cornus florida]
MEILSWLESQKVHHGRRHGSNSESDRFVIEVEEIKSLIKEVVDLYDKGGSSSDEVHLLRSFSFKEPWISGIFSDKVPWIAPLFYCRFNDMVNLAQKIRHDITNLHEKINPIMIQVINIFDKGSSVTWPQSHMPDRFLLLVNKFLQMINLAKVIHYKFGNAKEIEALRCRLIEIMSPTLAYVNMHRDLGDLTEDIKSIKREVEEIYEKSKVHGIGEGIQQITSSSHGVSANPIAVEEAVLGFDEDIRTLMELLAGDHEKDLKYIPIVGMPGLGKTTLARKVYNNPFIVYYFHIRAWTYVSQVYQKRDILLSIINSACIHVFGNIRNMSDEELGEHFYKALEGKRYLVVIDDLWSIEAWDVLKRYFPNDRNGSRIVFTTRLVNVAMALQAKPHHLSFLNEDESWNLLRFKVFRKESCPIDLIEIGKEIAKKCGGLPLAIVVISGLLAKKDKTEEWWKHVSGSVGSYIISDSEQYLDTLALSYNHLPQHLKPCFLYFGAFPEDYEIPVRQLISLGVAEGFIRQNEQKSLEEVAGDYLMDLIDRSLTIVSKKRSDGGIKACRVHDLLRELCLRKAREDNFLTSWHEQSSAYRQCRLFIHDNLVDNASFKPYEACTRSFLSFGRSPFDLPMIKDASFIYQAFMLLRVLNLLSIKIFSVPETLEKLVHLRYLAFHVEGERVRLEISNLWNLQTIIINGSKGSLYLNGIQKTVNLRHVYSTHPINIHGDSTSLFMNLQTTSELHSGSPSVLENLQTIGKLRGGHDLEWVPNLKKLKCQQDRFPKVDFLVHLETLSLIYNGYRRCSHVDRFPPKLKSLTLSHFRLPWDQMSILGSLPNLEVLKLSYKAFEGPSWSTSDGEFRKLQFLKLHGLDIRQWNTSSSHFPSLQTFLLDDCELLEEIPSSL